MWVEGGDIHDELLDQLGGVLAPPEDLALTPSAAEFEALAAAVAARWPEGAFAPGDDALPNSSQDSSDPAVSPIRRLRSGSARPLRRLGSSAWRAGSIAAGIVVFSASAAAAANGGVPLPRPVRVVAYNVGLPVDSPALDDTHQHIEELKDAVKANDKPKAEATARRLQKDLTKVPANEKRQAEKKVVAVMDLATPLIQSPAPTTTTTAPPPSSTTATAGPSSTTVTTAEEVEKKEQKAPGTTTTTDPAPTTSTAPESTTTTTAPETDETPPDGATTTTTAPTEDPTATTSTTTTTGPPPDETTTTTSSTTTTTAPPADPSAVPQAEEK